MNRPTSRLITPNSQKLLLVVAVLMSVFIGIAKGQPGHETTSALGLSWSSLGPDNLGGETRAVLIDKNDPTGQTIIAGGVCGGLWKSTNAGATWDTIAISIGNGSICCIAQDSSGNIFVGTGGGGFDAYDGGEGFSTAILGGGIFESTDDGATFNLLPSTKPSSSNSSGATWAYTNRIAVNPKNPLLIYAGTNQGLEMSIDGGNTWTLVVSGGTCLDVKISQDGALVVACCNGNGYYAYPGTSPSKFYLINQTGNGSLPTSGGGRIEFGITPGNSNMVYASVCGSFSFIGIYMTMTAISSGKGGYWYDIGPGGSKAFDPYSTGSADEGSYSNSIGVYSGSPSKALFGGVTLWAWQQLSPGDTVGGWNDITTAKYNSLSSLSYVHANIHNIQINGNNIYLGCDGGIYKSTDGGNTYQPYNRNYYSTEFFSLAFPPYVDPLNGEGLIGGTVDNGTIYISGKMFYPGDGVDRDSNDGGQCAISSLNPAIYYVTQSDGDDLLRSSGAPPVDIYTTTRGLNVGANIDSIAWQGSGCYVTPLALYENPYDTTTPDSMYWVANKAYGINDTIYPVSHNGSVSFPYILNKSVTAGDTVKVQNRVVSKIATAFSPSNRVWIMMQAANINSSPVWMPIGGTESTPDAFKGSDGVHCMAWSPNGDALFVGTVAGQFYRFSNLNTIVDSIYSTGAIMSMANGSKIPVINPNSKVISTSLSAALGVSGRDILSIAIDPKNGNHMLVTIGNYGNNDYLYYSNNALSVSPTFTLAQGNLPRMPVYGAILDIINSLYPNGAILATEHGTYSTTDATVAAPIWTQDNKNMTNTIAIAIKQQTLPPWNCNNSGKIYLATNGRGLYVDSTFFLPTGINEVNAPVTLEGKLIVYPNPLNSFGNILYSLPKTGNAKIIIYDLEGRLVEETSLTDTSPGLHKVRFNSQNMIAGSYIATLTGNGFRQSVKFVVVK